MNPDGLDLGCIINWKYVRSQKSGLAAPNRFHEHIRYRQACALEAITLETPPSIDLSKLQAAMAIGLRVMEQIGLLQGEYILKGVTGLARRDWGAALTNLWIAIEQVLSALWKRHIVEPTSSVDRSRTRRDQLNDTRTWTASARIEMLYQKSVIDVSTVSALSTARKARNDLAHEGKPPREADAVSAFEALQGLIYVAAVGQEVPLFQLDLTRHALSDPFSKPKPLKIEPRYWMPIPKLPGEEELEKAEAAYHRERR